MAANELVALTLSALALGGCVVVVQPPAPPNPPQGPAMKMAQGIANGEPSEVKPGQGTELWIWRTNDTGVWHVLSTTEGYRHSYRGLVQGASSPITWYQDDRIELGDSMGKHQDGLVFRFETAGHLDGLTFVPEDHGCVRFHVTVDERPQPDRIFVGPQGAHPPSDHFEICP